MPYIRLSEAGVTLAESPLAVGVGGAAVPAQVPGGDPSLAVAGM